MTFQVLNQSQMCQRTIFCQSKHDAVNNEYFDSIQNQFISIFIFILCILIIYLHLIIELSFDLDRLKTKIQNIILQKITEMMFKVALIFAVLTLQTFSAYVIVENAKPYCFAIGAQKAAQNYQQQWKFFYQVTTNVQNAFVKAVVQVFEQKTSLGKKIYTGSDNSTILDSTKTNYICFEPETNDRFYVLFQFYHKKHENLKQLVLKSQFLEVHKQLINFGNKLKDVAYNQKLFEVRQQIHGDMINSCESTVWKWAILKVLIVIAAIVSQIYFIRKLVGKDLSFGYI